MNLLQGLATRGIATQGAGADQVAASHGGTLVLFNEGLALAVKRAFGVLAAQDGIAGRAALAAANVDGALSSIANGHVGEAYTVYAGGERLHVSDNSELAVQLLALGISLPVEWGRGQVSPYTIRAGAPEIDGVGNPSRAFAPIGNPALDTQAQWESKIPLPADMFDPTGLYVELVGEDKAKVLLDKCPVGYWKFKYKADAYVWQPAGQPMSDGRRVAIALGKGNGRRARRGGTRGYGYQHRGW